MKKSIAVLACSLLFIFLPGCGSAKKDAAIQAPVPVSFVVSGKKLSLLGQGFKSASKMGFTAKIYKAGFYVEDTSLSAEDLISKNKVSHLYVRYVFHVTHDQLAEGWLDAYSFSCMEDCVNSKTDLRKFIAEMSPTAAGDEMEISFLPTGILLQLRGTKNSQLEIKSPVFSRNLLRVFIGPKVQDTKFTNMLLDKK